jgi:hypothetical protein
MCVCCEFCVVLGRGLCDGPIPRPEESYRVWCMLEGDQVKKYIKTLYTTVNKQVGEGRNTNEQTNFFKWQCVYFV